MKIWNNKDESEDEKLSSNFSDENDDDDFKEDQEFGKGYDLVNNNKDNNNKDNNNKKQITKKTK